MLARTIQETLGGVMKDRRSIQNQAGPRGRSQVVLPNKWQGESNCAIGPFASRALAEYFANPVTDFGHFDAFTCKLFAENNSWYVEVEDCEATQA